MVTVSTHTNWDFQLIHFCINGYHYFSYLKYSKRNNTDGLYVTLFTVNYMCQFKTWSLIEYRQRVTGVLVRKWVTHTYTHHRLQCSTDPRHTVRTHTAVHNLREKPRYNAHMHAHTRILLKVHEGRWGGLQGGRGTAMTSIQASIRQRGLYKYQLLRSDTASVTKAHDN